VYPSLKIVCPLTLPVCGCWSYKKFTTPR